MGWMQHVPERERETFVGLSLFQFLSVVGTLTVCVQRTVSVMFMVVYYFTLFLRVFIF